MAYEFNCPYCGYGMNKEDTEIHEDDHVGEWDVTCKMCKKEFELIAEAAIEYWAIPKEQS